MDFFASQDAARRKTSLLLLYFGLAVTGIVLGIYLVCAIFIFSQKTGAAEFSPVGVWDPELFFYVAGATIIVVLSGSAYKIAALRSGGARVAEMLGGRLIPAGTGDFLEKRLLNIIEEMAIASGVPVPPVYLMEQEKGINAFAAGFSPEDAVIGITRGALETLNREELQGVVAHEFSHILNGDMWLDLKLVGLLHGILLIAFIGRSILRGSSRNRSNKNSGGAVFLGFALLVIGYIGVLFGKLIKSAVSRQREYLADASAVQFTRNPQGLAGALKKIGGLAAGSTVGHTKAEEISHMFFSNSLKSVWIGAFSTHPPLGERIVRLEPSFNGVYPKVSRDQARGPETISEREKLLAKQQQPHRIRGKTAAAALTLLAADPQSLTRDIGVPLREHLAYARQLIDSIPETVRETAGDPFGARAIIYTLLLDRDISVRASQMVLLESGADKGVFVTMGKILPLMDQMAEDARLPLMDLAMVSLRSLSFEQFRRFELNIHDLVRIDKRISLFELLLEYVVVRRLERNFVKPLRSVREVSSISEVAADVSAVLSVLADLGNEKDTAPLAFSEAASVLPDAKTVKYLGRETGRHIKLTQILDRLAGLSPKIKKLLIAACFQCLMHDGRITMKEAEFFRLLVYGLDCPLPPWVRI